MKCDICGGEHDRVACVKKDINIRDTGYNSLYYKYSSVTRWVYNMVDKLLPNTVMVSFHICADCAKKLFKI